MVYYFYMPDLTGRTPEVLPVVPATEQAPSPELLPEAPAADRAASETTVPVASIQPAVPTSPMVPIVQTPALRQNVERILSEGLEETYKTLDPKHQQAFKDKGEETAAKIESLLQAAKVQVGKIVDLIKNWLKIIPGVNKYFL